jgi:hypothetical protein
MLIAALIFAVSLGLLIQFFVAYCRSLITRAYALELSEQAHQVTGIDDHHIKGSDFRRMLELVHLCPGPGTDRVPLGAVRAYYALLNALRSIVGHREWIENDQKSCSYFAAITLDRRIAHNRALMASQS